MIAQIVSHYRIPEKLGEGVMGEVYLAESSSLKHNVILKSLSETLQNNELSRKRFRGGTPRFLDLLREMNLPGRVAANRSAD